MPKAIRFTREAGTAYTVGDTRPSVSSFKPRTGLEARYDVNGLYSFRGADGPQLIVLPVEQARGAVDGKRVDRPIFAVDSIFLRNTSKTGVVAFPVTSGQTFSNDVSSYVLMSSTPISGGTGLLRGEIWFDEYSL